MQSVIQNKNMKSFTKCILVYSPHWMLIVPTNIYEEDSTKKFTILFNKFKPKTVSSQLTLTDTFSGSEHLPSTVRVIKQAAKLLRISLLNRNFKPDASSRSEATGISTETRKMFAFLSIFNAKLSHITRYLSLVNKLPPLSLFSSPI